MDLLILLAALGAVLAGVALWFVRDEDAQQADVYLVWGAFIGTVLALSWLLWFA